MIKPRDFIENVHEYLIPHYDKQCEIKLDANENNYGPSERVMSEIRNTSLREVFHYPSYEDLTKKIADYIGLETENIRITNGADEALYAVIQTYMNPGDALLTINPSFSMPEIYASIFGGKVIKVDYKEKWIFPVDAVLEAIKSDEVKIIYLASPNNPTGNIINSDDFYSVLKAAKDKVVILDETYSNFTGMTYDSDVLKYDNLFVIRSFSKDFALAGLRIGYVVSNSENIRNVNKVLSPYNVNALAVKAAFAALDDMTYFERIKKEISGTRYEMNILFVQLGAWVYESRANFILADFGKKAEYVYNTLLNNGIKVKKFEKCGVLENCLRVTVPTKLGMNILKNALKPKTLLVFDMDGVLIDASNSYRVAIQKVYESQTGKTVTFDEISEIKNQGGMNNDWDLTQFLLQREGVDMPYDRIVEIFDDFYWGKDEKPLADNENFLFDVELLKHLSERYNLAIYTGRTRKEAEYALNKFGVKDLFMYVITSDDVTKETEKPCPDGLNIIKEQLPAKNYVYFGDTSDDMKCAISAGYKAIGVLPPQDKSDELKNLLFENGASAVLNSINDIIMILENR